MFNEFFILGLTILVGFFALRISEKHKISQVIILMLFGFIIGPLLNVVHTEPQSIIRNVYPFMSSLALIVLLFDGGLSLNIFQVFKTITKSTLFTLAVFIATIFLFLILVLPPFNWSLINAIALGAVVGGTSSAIVIAMIEKVPSSEDTKSLLTLESTLSDSLVIIVAFLILQIINTPDISLSSFMNSFIGSFSIAVLFGIAGAFIWNWILQQINTKGLDYMLTLSALFILYALTEGVNANGGLAVFVFAITFSNLKNIPSYLLSPTKYKIEEIKDFQSEITFFTRTFFFTYIGLLFPLYGLKLETLLLIFFSTSLIIIARYVVSKYLITEEKYDRELISVMMPRGLAAAVVAGLIKESINIEDFETVVFGVIFLTNVIATFFVYLFQNGNGEKKEEKKEEKLDLEKLMKHSRRKKRKKKSKKAVAASK